MKDYIHTHIPNFIHHSIDYKLSRSQLFDIVNKAAIKLGWKCLYDRVWISPVMCLGMKWLDHMVVLFSCRFSESALRLKESITTVDTFRI